MATNNVGFMSPSLQGTVDKWRDLGYSQDRNSRYPGGEAILDVALICLRLPREKRYQDVNGLLAGFAAERLYNFLSGMFNSSEQLEEYNVGKKCPYPDPGSRRVENRQLHRLTRREK